MAEYLIHSGVRKRHTALKRRMAPVNAALVQHIGGFIIRRTRPVRISETQLNALLPQLKVAEAEGRLELRTPAGQLIDLSTLQVAAGEDIVSPPLPNFLPDSAARDVPAGMPVPLYQEGTGIMQEGTLPELLSRFSETDGTDETEPTETTVPEPVPTVVKNKGKRS